MSTKAKSFSIVAAIGMLLAANAAVAVHHLGTQAGMTYRWIDRSSGAVLTYSPSVFGSARWESNPSATRSPARWDLLSPQRPSPWLPWNWLAVTLSPSAPDPDAVSRLAAGQ
jgi:hypothetical protein